MRLLKTPPLFSVVNHYLVDGPLPSNLSYFWNYGSLLGVCLIVQILTGVFLAMHYTPQVELAFISIEHIMRDVNSGWLLRYAHANGASFFFILVYLHIGRALYFSSYKPPGTLLWYVGVILFLLMMATAFLGYVLPWGQMSFWGATVITNLLSALPWIGTDLVQFIWGGYSVDNATLNRFFSLHFLLPFLIAGLAMVHLMALHDQGGGNPLGVPSEIDKVPFHPYYSLKDSYGVVLFLIPFSFFLFFEPNLLGHPDNFIPANPLVTPSHIVPEWYFLPFYAILRSIPNKLGGVIAMFGSLLLLLALPFLERGYVRSYTFRPFSRFFFYLFVMNFIVLGVIGSLPVEEPYLLIGQVATFFYFFYLLTLLPSLGMVENLLPFLALKKKSITYIIVSNEYYFLLREEEGSKSR